MKSRTLNIILTVGLLALLVFNIRTCNGSRQSLSSISDIINYKDSAKIYKSKLGKAVYYNQSLEVTEKELRIAKDSLMKELEDLRIKKPKTITKIVTEIVFKDVLVYYTDTLPCDTFNVPFSYVDKWISLNGRSHNKGLDFASINITNDMLIVVGEKKNGLFKRNEQVVTVTSKNPYHSVTSLTNYAIKPKVAFHDKLWFKMVIFGGGIFVGTKL